MAAATGWADRGADEGHLFGDGSRRVYPVCLIEVGDFTGIALPRAARQHA